MKDELRRCGRCGHEHAYGILRYSPDNVPLYGARSCESCRCRGFVQLSENMENLPALSDKDTKDLWAQTSFLNAQVPMATRIAVRKIMESGKNWRGKALMEKQWPEFIGLMISQVTDIRGAMTRDENKFAHLVAHTDDIVESMRGVGQLSERLTGVNQRVDDVNERLDRIEAMLTKLLPKELENGEDAERIAHSEARRIFQSGNNAPIRDEAILTDGRHLDPDKTE